jgi:ssDNA-binding Zn-finger/Zn-ribbon topoisomerase 1
VGWEKAQRQRRVALPADLSLQVALGPVAWLWERLSGWQQDQVEAAAKTELARLAGLLAQQGAAPRLLADRLTNRLAETGGEALVDRPYPWLIRRGLVQRQACTDQRCDDGIRLDTGGECENCGNVIHLRRARRAQIAADIDRELPGLGDGERRRVLEERLREQAAIKAEDLVRRQEQARREAARAAAQEQAERERAATAAADAVRQALPCEDCGQQQAGGLCEACGYRRRTEALITEAGLVAAAWSADLTDPGDVAAVTAQVRATLEVDIAAARDQFLELMNPGELDADPVAAASALAFTSLQIVQQATPEYRRCALAMLARTQEAEAEATRAYATEKGRRQHRWHPDGPIATAAA